MPEIKSEIRRQDKYTIKIQNMPDGHIQSITIIKHNMDSEELGQLVRELDAEYHPLKLVVVDN